MAKSKGNSWTSDDLKAISGYSQMKDYRLSMCSRPNVRYIDRDGKEVVVDIQTVLKEWSIQKEEDRKERLQRKAAEKREAERASWGRKFQ